jgi:hypothetical protein
MMEALQEVQKRGDSMIAGIHAQRKILLSLQEQVHNLCVSQDSD